MMKKLIFLFLFLTQLLSAGYAKDRAYYENIIKSFHDENTDGRFLKKMDNQAYLKAMEDLMEVKIYAKENKLYDLQTDALSLMGNIYTNVLLSYDKAMECYLEAYQIILDKSQKNEEGGILNNIGVLYYRNKNMDKALEYFDRAYKIAVETKNNLTGILILNNLASISGKKGDLKQVEKYIHAGEEIVKNNPKDTLGAAFIECIKANYFFQKQQYDSLEQLALKALNQDIGKLYQPLEREYLFLLSQMYYQKKNYPQAIAYAKDASLNSTDLDGRVEIYEHLSLVYRAAGSCALALECQDSVSMLKDSLLQIKSMSQLLSGQIQFDLNNMEKKLEENKAKQKRNQLILVFIIVFIIALFLLILYIRSARNKQFKMAAELEKKEKLLLKQKVKEQKLEEQMYKNEIEMKNKQLVSNTLFQTSKNELLEDVISTLSKMGNAEIEPIIQQLQSEIKEPANTDWNSFLTYFEQVNSAFLFTLKKKHPNLTANDIRISAYIYLNLDTKEISKLLHITPESCKKKKQHLAQKLGMPTGEVYKYLSRLR